MSSSITNKPAGGPGAPGDEGSGGQIAPRAGASVISPFHYYSTRIPHDVSDNIATLPAGDMNNFVSLLTTGIVSMKQKPTDSVPSTFLDSDEWFDYLKTNNEVTSLSPIVDSTAKLTGFKLSMTPPKSTGTPADMVFTTGASKVPTSGILGEFKMAMFGLESSGSLAVMNLTEVVTYVGLPQLAAAATVSKLGDMDLTLKQTGRNAIWFDPGGRYRTALRLEFEPNLDKTKAFFNEFLKEFEVKSASVIAKRSMSRLTGPTNLCVIDGAEAILTAKCAVGVTSPVEFDATLTFRQTLMKLQLSTNSRGVLGKILDWLTRTVIPVGSDQLPSIEDWLADVGAPELRRISLTIELEGTLPSVVQFSVDMEVKLSFGGDNTVSLVTYSWVKGGGIGSLRGMLWFKAPASSKLLPDYEEYLVLDPITVPNPAESLSLEKMIPGGGGDVKNIPNGIPDEIRQASIEVDAAGIRFFGYIACAEPAGDDIPVSLDTIVLNASFTWVGKVFDLSFAVRGSIRGRQAPESQAVMLGSLVYSSTGTWELKASLRDLRISTLYAFFDSDSQDGVLEFLDKVEIRFLDLAYTYSKTQKVVLFSGLILIGGLELALDFTSNNAGSGTNTWTFFASLSPTNPNQSTIGDIVESIIGPSDEIPDFARSIEVGGADSKFVSLKCEKVGVDLYFAVSVNIESLKFTFVQYQSSPLPGLKSTKRAIKVSVSQLPSVDVPVLGNIARPFDEMFYLWVQDSSKGLGLTRAEVDSINTKLEASSDRLLFKERAKTKTPKDLVIAAGSHFVLVLQDSKGTPNVVLDHVFGASKGSKPPSSTGDSGSKSVSGSSSDVVAKAAAPPVPPPGGDSGSTMAPYKKSIGPLSISNIGFQYKDGALGVLFDATFLLGPVGFTLIGFSLNLKFGGKTNLQNLPDVTASINGLSVLFNRPPIIIAGLFEHAIQGDLEYYAGGIIVTFQPYLFKAAGFYGKMGGADPYESVFVFAKLEGPLITLGFADISGITGGFGYNVDLRFPRIDQVHEFPFLASEDLSANPMDALRALTKVGAGGWFTPRKDSFWVAAGLKVTAFQTLSIDAVIIVQWNPEISLGIFGIAVADIPKSSATSIKLAHVELQIAATIDFGAGVSKFEAQLSPNSFILSPSCHLTGGFALYCWFEGSVHDGDWVFTIGGFHPAFKRPDHYPNPPRLGISWSLDSSLSITGEAYFAITPKVCMGGGRLHASLSLGPLGAWFDAYADFLINYSPFHFTAEVGVSVGVSFTLDIWFVTIHISVEISARLRLLGPPISGTVYVDFWIFGFEIGFGPDPAPTPKATLAEFYQLVLQSGPPTSQSNPEPHILGCQTGLLPKNATPPDPVWDVRAGSFSFLISCRFPIGSAQLKEPVGENGAKLLDIKAQDDAKAKNYVELDTPIYSKPMRSGALTSTMMIDIVRDDSGAQAEWLIAGVVKPVANALWGQYNSSEDPLVNPRSSELLKSDKVSTNLMMGVLVTAPGPKLSDEKIEKYRFEEAMLQDVFSPPLKARPFPEVKAASTNWLPLKPLAADGQWGAVKEAWGKELGQDDSIAAWKRGFGWDNTLLGHGPPVLLKSFDEFYMAAPLLCRKEDLVLAL